MISYVSLLEEIVKECKTKYWVSVDVKGHDPQRLPFVITQLRLAGLNVKQVGDMLVVTNTSGKFNHPLFV
jgi:hypothetical protein